MNIAAKNRVALAGTAFGLTLAFVMPFSFKEVRTEVTQFFQKSRLPADEASVTSPETIPPANQHPCFKIIANLIGRDVTQGTTEKGNTRFVTDGFRIIVKDTDEYIIKTEGINPEKLDVNDTRVISGIAVRSLMRSLKDTHCALRPH